MAKFTPHDALDDATLLAQAQEQAERWARLVDAGAAHKGADRPERSRKRKNTSGRDVSLKEIQHFAPPVCRIDPPVRAMQVAYRAIGGMAIATCLKCGEEMRRKLDSDRPCSNCGNRFLGWQSRQTDTWLGEDYSLPSGWYGDLTGVGAHWAAVESLEHATQDRGVHTGGRSGQPKRVEPTGPMGTMRWLTTRTVSLAKTRSGRPKKAMVLLSKMEQDTLFHDGTSGHVGIQVAQ